MPSAARAAIARRADLREGDVFPIRQRISSSRPLTGTPEILSAIVHSDEQDSANQCYIDMNTSLVISPQPDRIEAGFRVLKEGAAGVDGVSHRRVTSTYLGDNAAPKVDVKSPAMNDARVGNNVRGPSLPPYTTRWAFPPRISLYRFWDVKRLEQIGIKLQIRAEDAEAYPSSDDDPEPSWANQEIEQDNYVVFHFHFEHLLNDNGVWRPGIYAIVAFHGQQYMDQARARVNGNNNEGQNRLDERHSGFPRFWTEPNLPGQRFRSTKALTALEVAAACGQEQMFDLIRDAGADESAWTRTQPSSEGVDDERRGADTGPSPALLTPWPAVIQTTPKFENPDPPVLARPAAPVCGATALGQTLLHIASLPLTSEAIDDTNPDVGRSIHCARTLDAAWLPHPRPSPLHLQPQPRSRLNPLRPRARTPLTPAEQEAQLETLRVLVDAGIDVRAQDVDGNTALHYLAATLNVDPRAMQLLRDMDGGEDVYRHVLNREGLSPRALWEGRAVQ
ncbi:uncharacterized protein P174DRAFT_499727 [Aspergillus novofumigatus IBT 16806]|uniref:Uncharacterized protein n=1 Tax=Aspergillus novofumigatus (strain IBT 16806) TaxID=1392255 RepID=A0A2I1CK26_ASPN1|nr:uncharacterized protein P174DRAFT_499727 [Aspergillus novofumigatus IBT 16806]PKX97977.1 hypothetical protein P174DRAFT_499727 [Aspergillus novofumigatus IBT 16806]